MPATRSSAWRISASSTAQSISGMWSTTASHDTGASDWELSGKGLAQTELQPQSGGVALGTVVDVMGSLQTLEPLQSQARTLGT